MTNDRPLDTVPQADVQENVVAGSIFQTLAMKPTLILLLPLFFASSLATESVAPIFDDPAEIHNQVKQLLIEQRPEEAAPLLEKALELNPEDTKALGRLGMIYTLMLDQPEKAKPLLTKGWDLGDTKCLQALAIAYIATNDHDGIRKHESDFLDNVDKLSGTKVICFFIAGQNLDEALFTDLLKKVTYEEIKEDGSIAKMIAQTAKLLAENKARSSVAEGKEKPEPKNHLNALPKSETSPQ